MMKSTLKPRKQMVIYSVSNLIAGFGSQTYAFAISFYILQTTGSALSFAIQLICNVVPRTLAGPFIGEFVDRYSKRHIIIYSQVGSLLVVLSLATYMYYVDIHLIAIYIASIFLSVTASFTSIAFSAAITQLFSESYIQKAMSVNQIAISSAAIVSPIVGGMIYGFFPLYGILLMFVGLFFIAVILNTQLSFQQIASSTTTEQKTSMLKNIKAGFMYTKHHLFAMRILLITLFINFIFAAFEIGYSYTLIQNFKMPAALFGITEAGFAVGMLGVSMLLAMISTVTRPMERIKVILYVLGITMISVIVPYYIPLSMASLVVYYFLLMLLIGITITSTNTVIFTVLQRTIDDEMKGRFFGLLETFAMAISPLSFALFGLLFDYFAAQLLLIGIGVAYLLVVIILVPKAFINKVDTHMREMDKEQPTEGNFNI